MKVAITGSTGLVGSRIVELLKDSIEFIPLQQKEVDITDRDSIHNKLREVDFDVFLHLAAYTNVDGAETERETAWKINVEGTRNTFEYAQEKNKKYIYISTDFVFDGKNPPYTEESTPNPTGYYGETKYEGEKVVGDNGMIARISYPYRAKFAEKNDFVRSLKGLLEQGKELKMITDSSITPTFIDDIALSLQYLIENYSTGLYHLVGGESMSPYDAAIQIAEAFDLPTNLVKETTFEEYSKGKALRPQYSEIISLKNTFHTMRALGDGLRAMKEQTSA